MVQILARKELKFERMSERDRKQIVAEVNILKDLDHGHIVRYYDRHVDREAGILYILMEYCGGGDLSSIIKQAQKHNRLVPEDTVWHYFMQILLALQHCHHPSCQNNDGEVRDRRPQILHRDLKPDNGVLSHYSCFLRSLTMCIESSSMARIMSNSVISVYQKHSHRRASQTLMSGYFNPFFDAHITSDHITSRRPTTCLQNSCKRKPMTQSLTYGLWGVLFMNFALSSLPFTKRRHTQSLVYIFGVFHSLSHGM